MKTATDRLFELISSMTGPEKSYFIKNSNPGKNYTRLFNSINSFKENYSDEELKKRLGNENFVKHLFATKGQLYEILLDSLYSFYEDSTVETKIKRKINRIDVLVKKGLYRQAVKLRNSVMDEVNKYELFYLMLSLLDWQKRLSVYYSIDERVKIIKEVYKEEHTALENLKLDSEYFRLYTELFLYVTKNGAPKTESAKKYIQDFMSNELIANYENAVTFRSKIEFNRIHILYYRQTEDFDKALSCCRQILKIYKSYPHMIYKYSKNYLDENLRYLIYCMNAKKFNAFEKHLISFRGIPAEFRFKIDDAHANVIFESYIVEMACYYSMKKYDRVISLVSPVQEHLDKSKHKIRFIIYSNFYRYTALAYFQTADYQNCLHWCMKYINEKTLDAHYKTRTTILVIAVICNYELRYFDLMDSLIRSAFRYFDKIEMPLEFEKLYLRFFNKLSSQAQSKDLPSEFEIMLKKLRQLLDKTDKNASLEKFELIEYLENKFSGKVLA